MNDTVPCHIQGVRAHLEDIIDPGGTGLALWLGVCLPLLMKQKKGVAVTVRSYTSSDPGSKPWIHAI